MPRLANWLGSIRREPARPLERAFQQITSPKTKREQTALTHAARAGSTDSLYHLYPSLREELRGSARWPTLLVDMDDGAGRYVLILMFRQAGEA